MQRPSINWGTHGKTSELTYCECGSGHSTSCRQRGWTGSPSLSNGARSPCSRTWPSPCRGEWTKKKMEKMYFGSAWTATIKRYQVSFHSAHNEQANWRRTEQCGEMRNGWKVPAVHGYGCEIQQVFALEEQHFSPDLHDRRRVDGHTDAEQRQLRSVADLAVPHALLAVEVLQPSPKLQSLESWKVTASE